jgi:predicted small metal-binding protein
MFSHSFGSGIDHKHNRNTIVGINKPIVRRPIMGKIIHCKDVGFECDGVVRAGSEEEVMQMAAEHAKTVHGVDELTSEMVAKVKSVIRNEH